MKLEKQKTIVDEIFEKKSFFKPSLAEVITNAINDIKKTKADESKESAQPIDDEFRKEIVKTINSNGLTEQEQIDLINKADERSQSDLFISSYYEWARDNSKTLWDKLPLIERFTFRLGKLYADPEKYGLPDFIYVSPKYRPKAFLGHYDTKTIHTQRVSQYMLHTTKMTLQLREKLINQCDTFFLVIGLSLLAFGAASTAIYKGADKVAVALKPKSIQEQIIELSAKIEKANADFRDDKITKDERAEIIAKTQPKLKELETKNQIDGIDRQIAILNDSIKQLQKSKDMGQLDEQSFKTQSDFILMQYNNLKDQKTKLQGENK